VVSPSPGDVFALGMFVAFWFGVGAIILVRAWQRVVSGANSFGDRVGGVFQASIILIVLAPMTAGGLALSAQLAHIVSLWTAALLAGCAVLNIVFFELLKAPTIAGRKVMDDIDGFRMYLGTAEKDRLEALTPPKETPQLFEQYLPYAIALDVENQWNKRFEHVFAEAAQAPGTSGTTGYSPAWYSGSRMSSLTTGGFAGALGGALAAAAASAATAPGSSSGMGGGSSGGGGGGGGGGGW
jgi:uncharacterized membrane protein